MARIRLGKRERALVKAQYALVKSAKADLIAHNLANLKAIAEETKSATCETGGRSFSTGYRRVDLNQGYTFHGASNMKRPDMRGADKGYAKTRY